MNVKDLPSLDFTAQKENKVTTALLQVLDSGGANLLRSFIGSGVCFLILTIVLFYKHQLRCREPVAQLSCRVCTISKIKIF